MSTTAIAVPSNSIQVVRPLANGDVLLAGWAAVLGERDRQNDRWTAEAFARSIDPFMQGARPLKFDHGRVEGATGPVGTVESLDLDPTGYGVRATAVLTYMPPDHPQRPIYRGVVESKVIDGFSFGGYLSRRGRLDGTSDITGISITELSITGRPVGYSTSARPVAVGGDPWDDIEARLWLAGMRAELGM